MRARTFYALRKRIPFGYRKVIGTKSHFRSKTKTKNKNRNRHITTHSLPGFFLPLFSVLLSFPICLFVRCVVFLLFLLFGCEDMSKHFFRSIHFFSHRPPASCLSIFSGQFIIVLESARCCFIIFSELHLARS